MACDLTTLKQEATCVPAVIPPYMQAAAMIVQLCDLIAVQNNVLLGVTPSYELQVVRGNVPGVSGIHILGHNIDVDTATLPEDIWEGGGVYPFQATAQSLEILSSSAADTALGTGARTVLVEGLDAGYVEQSQVVTLNGVGAVALAQSYLRINHCEVVTAGTGRTNAGIITLRVAGAGATQAVIDTSDGVAMQAIYTVPAGKALYLVRREMGMSRETTAATIEIQVMTRGPLPTDPWLVRNIIPLQAQGTSAYVKDIPFNLMPEKTDLRATVVICPTNNVGVTATIDALLLTN